MTTPTKAPDLSRIRSISNQLASFTQADLDAVKEEIWRLEILRDLIAATLGTVATTTPVVVPVGNALAPAATPDAGARNTRAYRIAKLLSERAGRWPRPRFRRHSGVMWPKPWQPWGRGRRSSRSAITLRCQRGPCGGWWGN